MKELQTSIPTDMQNAQEKQVDVRLLEGLEVVNWKNARQLNPQPHGMWKITPKPEMVHQEGYYHKFNDKCRNRKIFILYDGDYFCDWFFKNFLEPLGIITPEGTLNKQLYEQLLTSVIEYAESKSLELELRSWGETFSSVRERDVNFILAEEFTCSDHFRTWFLKNTVGLNFGINIYQKVKSQVYHPTGESDIEVYFSSYTGDNWRFLIENKINAKFQISQGERYKKRGQAYVDENKCIGFSTVLIAPKSYLNKCNENFDFYLTYEQLQNWFINYSQMGERGKYKAKQIELAIKKASTNYRQRRSFRVIK
jgi:hypothetical protein